MNVSAACPQCGAMRTPTTSSAIRAALRSSAPAQAEDRRAELRLRLRLRLNRSTRRPPDSRNTRPPRNRSTRRARASRNTPPAPGSRSTRSLRFPGNPSLAIRLRAADPRPGRTVWCAVAFTFPPRHALPAGSRYMPGMSYCAQGHPIALDAMQFANDPNAAYAPAAPPPPPPYGAPGGYGQPAGPPPFDPPRPGPGPGRAQGLGFGGPPAYQPPPAPQGGFGGGGFPPGAPQQPVFQPAAVPPPQASPQYAPPPGVGGFRRIPGRPRSRAAPRGGEATARLRGDVPVQPGRRLLAPLHGPDDRRARERARAGGHRARRRDESLRGTRRSTSTRMPCCSRTQARRTAPT